MVPRRESLLRGGLSAHQITSSPRDPTGTPKKVMNACNEKLKGDKTSHGNRYHQKYPHQYEIFDGRIESFKVRSLGQLMLVRDNCGRKIEMQKRNIFINPPVTNAPVPLSVPVPSPVEFCDELDALLVVTVEGIAEADEEQPGRAEEASPPTEGLTEGARVGSSPGDEPVEGEGNEGNDELRQVAKDIQDEIMNFLDKEEYLPAAPEGLEGDEDKYILPPRKISQIIVETLELGKEISGFLDKLVERYSKKYSNLVELPQLPSNFDTLFNKKVSLFLKLKNELKESPLSNFVSIFKDKFECTKKQLDHIEEMYSYLKFYDKDPILSDIKDKVNIRDSNATDKKASWVYDELKSKSKSIGLEIIFKLVYEESECNYLSVGFINDLVYIRYICDAYNNEKEKSDASLNSSIKKAVLKNIYGNELDKFESKYQELISHPNFSKLFQDQHVTTYNTLKMLKLIQSK